jgi:hypothetical protein
MENKPTPEFMELYNTWKDLYKELNIEYYDLVETKSKFINLQIRMERDLDAKILHPLPKNE